MPKLPGKFDDVAKTAKSVLNDDFQCGTAADKKKNLPAANQFQFKTKSKSNLGGTAELEVDVGAAGAVQTPTKLTFKVPNTLLPGLSVDKFEIASKGTAKLECGLGKECVKVDGLKVDLKSEIKNPSNPFAFDFKNTTLSYGLTFTGVNDFAFKLDGKCHSVTDDKNNTTGPMDSTLEVLHGRDVAGVATVIGAKVDVACSPSVNLSFAKDNFFLGVTADKLTGAPEFGFYPHYKVSNDISVAASYMQGGEKNGSMAVACSAKLFDGTFKGKFSSGKSSDVCLGFKKDLAKGTTFLGGMKFDLGSSDTTFGAKFSVE